MERLGHLAKANISIHAQWLARPSGWEPRHTVNVTTVHAATKPTTCSTLSSTGKDMRSWRIYGASGMAMNPKRCRSGSTAFHCHRARDGRLSSQSGLAAARCHLARMAFSPARSRGIPAHYGPSLNRIMKYDAVGPELRCAFSSGRSLLLIYGTGLNLPPW